MKREDLLVEEFPNHRFHFHIWAHQGREPAKAVPRGLQPLFLRHER
jgi:hypothetical protein